MVPQENQEHQELLDLPALKEIEEDQVQLEILEQEVPQAHPDHKDLLDPQDLPVPQAPQV